MRQTIIDKVANGYVVTEVQAFNPYEGLKEVVAPGDPMLSPTKKDLGTLENVHVFLTFEEVLAFLANKHL